MKFGPQPAWIAKGLCRGLDPTQFFDPYRIPQAKRVCQDCTVRQECLDYALTADQRQWGVWGGLSAPERESILYRRRMAAEDEQEQQG